MSFLFSFLFFLLFFMHEFDQYTQHLESSKFLVMLLCVLLIKEPLSEVVGQASTVQNTDAGVVLWTVHFMPAC